MNCSSDGTRWRRIGWAGRRNCLLRKNETLRSRITLPQSDMTKQKTPHRGGVFFSFYARFTYRLFVKSNSKQASCVPVHPAPREFHWQPDWKFVPTPLEAG